MSSSDTWVSDSGITSRPFGYWLETRRPFCNLIFLLPLLLSYEIGVAFIVGPDGELARNGADAWMRLWLRQAGIEMVWLLPTLLVGTLLVWQLTSRQPWRTSWDTLGGMAAESLMYAFLLILLGQLTDYGFRHAAFVTVQMEDHQAQSQLLIRLVMFMGAGIYEEFLFRLCLLSVVYFALRAMLFSKGLSVLLTVLLTSLVFSLAHYLPSGSDDHFQGLIHAATRVHSTRELWFSFAFRTVAGIFFAALYFFRGFGITVGAHAAYDVCVGVFLVSEI